MQRPETGIKDCVEEVEPVHKFLFGPFRPKKKKTGLSFQMSRCSAGMTQKVEFHLLSNRIFRKLFVKGKQPYKLSPLTSNFNLHGLASKFSFGDSSV